MSHRRRVSDVSDFSDPDSRPYQRWQGWQEPLSDDDEAQMRDSLGEPYDYTPADRRSMNADNEQVEEPRNASPDERDLTGTERDFDWPIRDVDAQGFVDSRGYSYVDEPNPLLVCSICHEPMQDPLCSTVCQHSFCRSCLMTWAAECDSTNAHLTCPMDRQRLHISSFEPAPHLVQALISELHVTCRLSCGWQGPREALREHYKKTCPEVMIDMHNEKPKDSRRIRWKKTIGELEERLELWRLMGGVGREPTFVVPDYVKEAVEETTTETQASAPNPTPAPVVVFEETVPVNTPPRPVTRPPTPVPWQGRSRARSTPVPPSRTTDFTSVALPPTRIDDQPSTSTAPSTAASTSAAASTSQAGDNATRDLVALSEQLQRALQMQTARVEAAANEARQQEEAKTRRAVYERTFRHYAQCFGCRNRIVGHRYRCLICPNTDYCEPCFNRSDSNHTYARREAHREHPFFRMDSATSKAHTHAIRQDIIEDHHEVQCQHCGISPITGPRYKCIDARCKGVPSNYCNECIHAVNYRHPPHHQMIRITMAETKPGWGSWLRI